MALDTEMFKTGAFISDNATLLQVKSVRTTGSFPTQKRLVMADDCMAPLTVKDLRHPSSGRVLNEVQMQKFHLVRKGT